MEILKIQRKGRPVLVTSIKVKDLDASKLSNKFKIHEIDGETSVYVKCLENGTLDLRGNKQEYRIIMPDKF